LKTNNLQKKNIIMLTGADMIPLLSQHTVVTKKIKIKKVWRALQLKFTYKFISGNTLNLWQIQQQFHPARNMLSFMNLCLYLLLLTNLQKLSLALISNILISMYACIDHKIGILPIFWTTHFHIIIVSMICLFSVT
jgi:hypothetical protein